MKNKIIISKIILIALFVALGFFAHWAFFVLTVALFWYNEHKDNSPLLKLLKIIGIVKDIKKTKK